MTNRFDKASRDAAAATDQILAAEIAKVSTLSAEQIAAICPEPGDANKLQSLLDDVRLATDSNERQAAFKEKLETSAAVCFRLVKTLIKPV